MYCEERNIIFFEGKNRGAPRAWQKTDVLADHYAVMDIIPTVKALGNAGQNFQRWGSQHGA
jgi:hypothetical protein